MHRLLVDVFERIRAGLVGPPGRHRTGGASAAPPRPAPPRPAPPRPTPPAIAARPAPTVRHWYEPLDGEATALVRPYLRAYEWEYVGVAV
ncbi:hypothetical protein AMK26_27430 [Streptomyces sp. CB03234]|uniref:hypothetical protein n=1 Tax=Streptomyces sp. (strain CB03234) TaxID=1703937 RepID=UPI00093B065C|nr:hypothetical protein [Streptomyces sp. CB03234]OKJ99732.1 hypothetical protein AMK26_27430 [Streptomyces sp. CB03234]